MDDLFNIDINSPVPGVSCLPFIKLLPIVIATGVYCPKKINIKSKSNVIPKPALRQVRDLHENKHRSVN